MPRDRLQKAFDENFASRGEIGASVSVWRDGTEIANLASGFRDREKTEPWTGDTPVLVWSSMKGPAAACLLHCLEKNSLTPSTRVAEIWPAFAQNGKHETTIAHVLSHRAGLPVLPPDISVFDYDAIVAWLASQPPLWKIGDGHGYHPRTFGFLLDEIIRRISGQTLASYWQKNFAQPLQIEAWFGVPEDQLARVAPILSPRAAKLPDTKFFKNLADPASLTARAFAPAPGIGGFAGMNTREARTASFPAFGGIATARALAKFYAMLACGGELGGTRFFSDRALGWITTPLAHGDDKVLATETTFTAGFMKNIGTLPPRAFGHPGAGGSLAFADPARRLAFAYTMNQMDIEVLPADRPLSLAAACAPTGES